MIAGNLLAFRGDDEVADEGVLVELTDFTKEGKIEVAFDYGKERLYVKFRLADLFRDLGENNGSAD